MRCRKVVISYHGLHPLMSPNSRKIIDKSERAKDREQRTLCLRSAVQGKHYKSPRNLLLKGWTRRTMLRDAWTNDGGKGWWRWWSRLGGLLAMAAAISCLVAPFPGASANPEAKRLYDDLLSNYNRLIRPVGNNSDRLTVKMGLRLSQLIDVVSRTHLTHYPAAWIAFILSIWRTARDADMWSKGTCVVKLSNVCTCFIDWCRARRTILARIYIYVYDCSVNEIGKVQASINESDKFERF